MSLKREIQEWCSYYNISPSRAKGQNFLISESVLDHIITNSDLKEEDEVIEVGPGGGFLTAAIAPYVKKVTAVEFDQRLYKLLKKRLKEAGIHNVEVINKDILKIKEEELKEEDAKYKIVANLPYNITSIFLRRFLAEAEKKPTLMVLMVQKEVAERIAATPPASILSVMVQFYSQPEIIKMVPRKNFWPSPRVDSALLKLNIKEEIPPIQEDLFFDLVRKSFSSRRKMLKNNLVSGYKISPQKAQEVLKEAGISSSVRAQELYLEDWLRLFGVIREDMI